MKVLLKALVKYPYKNFDKVSPKNGLTTPRMERKGEHTSNVYNFKQVPSLSPHTHQNHPNTKQNFMYKLDKTTLK